MNSPVNASDSRDANPYVGLFVDNLLGNIKFNRSQDKLQNNPSLKSRAHKEADTILFPMAYAGLVESTFEYIQANGVFDETRLDSLNFFNNNTNCIPENVADLLDIQGILKEINDEMLDALCYDEDSGGTNPMGSKIRDVIRYGLFLLLIQIHIAQFIIKNIFVFAAYEIDDFFTVPVVKEFMAVTIRQQMETLVRSHPLISQAMVKYFNKKIKRKTSLEIGGLANTYNEIVFEEGKIFDGSDFPAIIEYMTGNRIFNSRLPVSNAVKKSSDLTNPKSFNRSFVEDILTIQPSFFGATDGEMSPLESAQGMARRRVRQNSSAPNRTKLYDMMALSDPTRIAGRDKARAYLSAETPGGQNRRKNLEYGKFVLERQVVWTSVISTDTTPVPDIFKYTTGEDYGLELDLFKMVLFNPAVRSRAAGSTEELSLQFANLAIKHQIVYYLPTLDEDNGNLFYRNSENLAEGALSKRHRCDLGNGLSLRRVIIDRLNSALPLGPGSGISTSDTALRYVLGDLPTKGNIPSRKGYIQAEIPVLKTQLDSYNESVSASELALIVADPVFQNYFDKAFNRTLITMVPIIHNFYLTTSFFPKMQHLLGGPKQRCIQIFVDSVLNENATAASTALSPQAQAANRQNSDDPFAGLNQSAIDFILKMLIETPINILKGLSELLDPHVALSKIIRDITGFAFAQAAKAIDAAPPIEALKNGPPPDEEGNSPGGIAPAISGEGVLKLLFCMLQIAMKAAGQGYVLSTTPVDSDEPYPPPLSLDSANFLGEGPLGEAGAIFIGNPPVVPFSSPHNIPGAPTWDGLTYVQGDKDPRDPRNTIPDEIRDNFYPRITVKGVDFTGTFLGLLMLPPGPFGIVYLLLMLLKNELEDALTPDDEAGTQNVSDGESSSEC
jgi:hypothetical protein